jgi:DNA-binding response OmpR family regulator
MRKVLESDLAEAGYTVETADSADRATLLAQQSSPDVVLIDVHLGDGPSGLMLARNLRDQRGAQKPFIVLTSAQYSPTWLAFARDAGCDRFLVKPFATEVLVDLVEQFMTTKGTAP